MTSEGPPRRHPPDDVDDAPAGPSPTVAALDVTDAFAVGLARDDRWTRADSERTVHAIARRVDGATVLWDAETGDYWAWVTVGDRVIALVHTRVPLVFVATDHAGAVPDDVGNVVVLDPLEGRRLSCDPAVIGRYRFGSPISDTLDPAGFSLGELAFATD